MIWRNVQYEMPQAALLLVFIGIIFGLFVFLYRYREEKLTSFADPKILKVILQKRDPISFGAKWCCVVSRGCLL